MPDLLVVGASDPFARDVIEAAELSGHTPILVDPVHDRAPWGAELLRLDLLEPGQRALPAVIGDAVYPDFAALPLDQQMIRTQRRLREDADRQGVTHWVTLVHPSAVVYSTAVLGAGVYISANATVASSSVLGRHVRVNRNAGVGHDVVIGDGAQIGPSAVLTSGCDIGAEAFVGAGATVLNGVRVAAASVIAAGSLVTGDVPPGSRVRGVPAQPWGRSQ